MKKFIAAAAIGVAALFAASSASAFSVALDVPLIYDFNENGAADEVTGFKLGLGIIPFPVLDLGLGYEAYEVTDAQTVGDLMLNVSIVDVFIDIPFPLINIVIGAGVGTAEFEFLTVSEEVDVQQFYISLGYPIVPLFDVHFGYHQVNVDEITDPAFSTPVDVSGTMWSLGLKVGF